MVPFDYVLIGIAVLFLFFRVKDWIKGDRKYEDKEIESRKERRERKRCERELKKECKRHKRERAKDEERWGREYAEARRRSDVSRVRRQMPCLFIGKPTPAIFKSFALETADHFARIKSIWVSEAVVYATVESRSGCSDWKFNVDFNNWGHIDGTFWTYSDNDDSSIPKNYGKMLSRKISDYLSGCDKAIPDCDVIVQRNTALGTEYGLNTYYREGIIAKLFRIGAHCISVAHNATDFCGEHIYLVISILKQAGFVNIKSIAIEDVDNRTHHYVYEVEKVSIAGDSAFHAGHIVPHNAEVIIHYHSKRRIMMPISERKCRRKNYLEIGEYLQELGFSEVYECKIKDLVFGLLTKDGSVENVFIGDGETPIVQGKAYYYDTKIIICYHTYK